MSIIPAAGDIEAKNSVKFTGVDKGIDVTAQTMNWISYTSTASLEVGNDNMTFGVNYNLQMGSNATNHGVMGTFRYEF